MANRQQRRAAKHKGKHQGETYADVLAQKKMIKEAVEKSAHSHAVTIESDVKAQRQEWMAIVALNRAFGFGCDRARRFMVELGEVAQEVVDMAEQHGAVYANAKLMEAASKILEAELSPVHEEEMRQARLANEAEGIFFPADDPDKW